MRRLLRFLWLALVLLLVALTSALTAMRFAIHGREVAVPKLVGLSLREAERAANAAGLVVAEENRFYSTEIPAGRVVSQLPAPGARVRRGWRVRVAESLGPQRILIPNLLGQSGRAAQLNARRRGLELGSVATARIPGRSPDQVVSQSPPPAASGIAVPKISLLLSAPGEGPAFVMPNFVGRHLADAAAQIEKAGLKLKIAETRNTPPETGTSSATLVLGQQPAAGQKVLAGSTVILVIAK